MSEARPQHHVLEHPEWDKSQGGGDTRHTCDNWVATKESLINYFRTVSTEDIATVFDEKYVYREDSRYLMFSSDQIKILFLSDFFSQNVDDYFDENGSDLIIEFFRNFKLSVETFDQFFTLDRSLNGSSIFYVEQNAVPNDLISSDLSNEILDSWIKDKIAKYDQK